MLSNFFLFSFLVSFLGIFRTSQNIFSLIRLIQTQMKVLPSEHKSSNCLQALIVLFQVIRATCIYIYIVNQSRSLLLVPASIILIQTAELCNGALL